MVQKNSDKGGFDAFLAALGDIPVETAANIVKQKSRDFFWYSPILKQQLEDCRADAVATPRSEADILRIAALCARHGVPLTVRGAGTGNYGQAVPLQGGLILDMIALDAVGPVRDGIVRVGAGAKMRDIDDAVRPQGWELRMFPSTIRTATIGGFIAGGSGGVGSINYGMLSQRGTILGLRVVTLEVEPQVIELRGEAVNQVHHAYGTNGIITEIEMALAPAQTWIEVGAAFGDFIRLAEFCQALGEADGIAKKLITAIAAPIPGRMRTLPFRVPSDASLGLMMIAAASLEPFRDLLAAHGGELIYCVSPSEAAVARATPIYEFTWNHTTLQMLKVDREITYLQTAFPDSGGLDLVDALCREFAGEIFMHLEFVRVNGQVVCRGLPLVRYTTPDRLAQIIKIFEARGSAVFNPHTFVLEDGGRKQTDEKQSAFKGMADPFGLLNPGKMRGAPPPLPPYRID
jgi:FAD/FMN-containing dehydrogenase